MTLKMDDTPLFDDEGINLADPHDRLGRKTTYISQLQEMALARHAGDGQGLALDLGCGYGRMTSRLASLGYRMCGLDPSLRVLRHAARVDQAPEWVVGRLPSLPFSDGAFQAVFLLNVVRSLHLLGLRDLCTDATRVVGNGGRLVVLDNVRRGDSRYVEDEWFLAFFQRNGLKLKRRVPIRASRWPVIYLIRYGLIPVAWLPFIARWELDRMEHVRDIPRFSYHNVIYVFEKS